MKQIKAEKTVRDIRRRTRKPYFAKDKVRIGFEGLRGAATLLS